MFALSDYSYHLPEDRIAQFPEQKRDASRLMHLDKVTGLVSHHRFYDLPELLNPRDLLVINDTRVIPARLKGTKATGGKVEVLILDYLEGIKELEAGGFFQCRCLVKASKRPTPGTMLFLGPEIKARVEKLEDQMVVLKFFCNHDFNTALKAAGEMPLPPYIRRSGTGMAEDRDAYQTVYASREGAVAAPTAGLHFTEPLMARLEEKGIEFAKITLHVGYGTFVPVRVEDIREHVIHSEVFSVSEDAADKINLARKEKRRIVAVGTTSVRTLEFLADDSGKINSGSGMCDLYIYPGYRFKIVDAMITNFHLPESTLIMLVSAFAGRENVLNAYRLAVASQYRFFSYGDAMLIQ